MRARVVLSCAGLAGVAILYSQINAQVHQVKVLETDGDGGIAGGCTPNTGPDVIVGDLIDMTNYGAVGGITGYSIGTTSCNIGSVNLMWQACNTNHPVIAQNIYRLKDGRFEQVGLGWLKHGFTALTQNLCCTCNGQGGPVLGIGCSDPYVSSLNGDQNGNSGACGAGVSSGGLGPRYQVNATTGAYTWPYFANNLTGNAIYKRIQVLNTDLNPAMNPMALYYGEGQYVSPDDAANANLHNNASYERILVGALQGNGGYALSLTGATTREKPAINAWKDNDALVEIKTTDVIEAGTNNKGRLHLGYRVTDNGDGTWHYEYALYNMNSHRSAREFIVPVPAGVTVSNVGFHDIDHHSGDGEGGVTYDVADWVSSVGGSQVSWATDTFAANPNANALRWGSLYNFRFDASTAPEAGTVTIGLYRVDGQNNVTSLVPSAPRPPQCAWDCDGSGDAIVNVVDLLALLAQYDATSPVGCLGGTCDFNGVGCVDVVDLLKLLAHYDPAGLGCP